VLPAKQRDIIILDGEDATGFAGNDGFSSGSPGIKRAHILLCQSYRLIQQTVRNLWPTTAKQAERLLFRPIRMGLPIPRQARSHRATHPVKRKESSKGDLRHMKLRERIGKQQDCWPVHHFEPQFECGLRTLKNEVLVPARE